MTTTLTPPTTGSKSGQTGRSDRHDWPDRPDHTPARPSWRDRARAALSARRHSALYVLPLLVVTALASRIGFSGAPQRIDDEGTYVAQAWAVQNLGTLGHYTYWYDHPPLGWIQIAAWTWVTDGFTRYGEAVIAGREAMVIAHVISAGLLWVLARRLDLGRPAAAAAVLVYALSPLAVQFTRTVYLDNVATPWALAAFALSLTRSRQLLAFTAAAAFLAVAVLSKETYLLLAPFLGWQMWRSAHPSTRRYTLSVAAAVFALTGLGYILFALVKGEALPGQDQVSLWEGITFQLFDRAASGSVLDPASQAGLKLNTWLTLDAALLVASVVAGVLGLVVHRLRPYAVLYLFLIAVLFKPGYLPAPQIIVMLPFAALLVAAVAEAGLRRWRSDTGATPSARARGRGVAMTAGVGVLAFVVTAAPLWTGQLRVLWAADLDDPLAQAQSWIADNVERDQRLLVDDAVWVDLVEAGFEREDVVWYYKADTDSQVSDLAPNGWRDYDYVLLTPGIRRSAEAAPTVDEALENATTTAVFGSGQERVEVFRVHAEGGEAHADLADRDTAARTAAGQALAENRALQLTDEARETLRDGGVDSRVVSVLAQVAANHTLGVVGFPSVPGEQGQLPARTVVLDSIDGEPVTSPEGQAVAAEIADQVGAYEPDSVDVDGDQLMVRFGVADPADVLPAPADA